jgi:hypothetical protein
MTERIEGPAMRLNGEVHRLPAPARHIDVVRLLQSWEADQGFWTNERPYVSREEAWDVAEAAGQITQPELARRPRELFTECMW